MICHCRCPVPNTDRFDDRRVSYLRLQVFVNMQISILTAESCIFAYGVAIPKKRFVSSAHFPTSAGLELLAAKGSQASGLLGWTTDCTNELIRTVQSLVRQGASRSLFPLSFALSVSHLSRLCPGSSRVPKEDTFLGDTSLMVPRLRNNAQNMIQMSELATGSFGGPDMRQE